MTYVVQYKYFSVLYSPIKNHSGLLSFFSDRTLAASGAFWLKPIYSADLTSLGSNTIVVCGFSDDSCYSSTYPGHIKTFWTFWECFVDLTLVVVVAVTDSSRSCDLDTKMMAIKHSDVTWNLWIAVIT